MINPNRTTKKFKHSPLRLATAWKHICFPDVAGAFIVFIQRDHHDITYIYSRNYIMPGYYIQRIRQHDVKGIG